MHSETSIPAEAAGADSIAGEAVAASATVFHDRVTMDPPSRWRWAAPWILIVLVLLAFMPALDAGLVNWDDDDLLFHNTRHHTLDGDSLHWMFTTSFAGHFQPLTWLSYWLDWTVWHREFFGFHLTSVLLHALTALALYSLIRRLLVLKDRNRPDPRSSPIVLAGLFGAALFAVHPLRVESVAWLAERRDVLSGLFYVLSVLCYVRYAAEGSHSRIDPRPTSRERFFYAAALILCGVSLLAKAAAVTLPLVLLILDVYPLRRWPAPQITPATSSAGYGRLLLEKVPFLLLGALCGWRAIIAQDEGGALYGLGAHDLLARSAQACYGVAFYLWKTMAPTNLGPLYEIPPRSVLLGSMLWISAVAVMIVLALSIAARKRFPAIPAAVAVYVVVVFPVLGFAQSGPQLVADRYSYLSCMSFSVVAAAFLARTLQNGSWRNHPQRRAVAGLVCMALITLLTRATFAQSDVWLSDTTLWRHGVKVSPQSHVAHTNFGDALARSFDQDGAARHYRRALELEPRDTVAWHHFGNLHARLGDREAAIACYLRALSIDPNRLGACFSLGRLLMETGRPQEAAKVLRDGARRHPDALELIDYLARLLSTCLDDRVRDGEEALRLALYVNRGNGTGSEGTLLTLAGAYAETGRFAKAVEVAQQAMTLAGHHGNTLFVDELQRRLSLFRDGKPYHSATFLNSYDPPQP